MIRNLNDGEETKVLALCAFWIKFKSDYYHLDIFLVPLNYNLRDNRNHTFFKCLVQHFSLIKNIIRLNVI